MAKGGGRMSFTGGTYNAGKIVIDANEALKSANDLDAALQRVGSTLTNLSKGRDVSALWNAQAASIENVVQALEQFRRNTESVGNAEGLVKAMNAFSAWHPDENISSYFDRMGDGAQALIDKAKQLAVNLDSAFDVSSLREAFQVFEMLKSAGVDLEQIFSKLRAGDVSTLTQQVETLERQLTHTRYRAQELQDQVDQFQSGDAFVEMQEKINQYESAMERAKSEFRSFLSASGFAGDDLDEYYGRFSELFERIGNGSLTVKEAMAQVREEYSHMFQSAGADQILEIMTRLESLGTALEGIKETLANMGMANSGSASLGEMREYLVQGADAAAHQREELAQLSAQSASLQGLIDVLVRLSQANAEADTGMAGVHQSIVELLSSVQSLGQIDVGNLQQVSDILRSFVKMDGISVGKASVQNLVSAFESLSRLPSTSSLSGLAAIDFSNLSNLKVSKAALSNLAEFLPSISGINVVPLQQLASIDWTNLSNLKVSKASLSNLSEMAQTTGLSPDTSGFTSVQSAIDKIGSSLDGLQAKIKSTFDLSNAIAQAGELEKQYTGIKAALDAINSASKVAAGGGGGGGKRGGGSNGDNPDDLERLIDLYVQYYDAMTRVENARASKNNDSVVRYSDMADALDIQINKILEANAALQEQAEAESRVQQAMNRYADAADKAATKMGQSALKQQKQEAEEVASALEKLQKRMDGLSIDSPTIQFADNDEHVENYTRALNEAKAALVALQNAEAGHGSEAVRAAQRAVESVEQLKNKYNQAAKSARDLANAQTSADKLADKISVFLSKNSALSADTKAKLQAMYNELTSGAAAGSGSVKALSNEFDRLRSHISETHAGGKTFFQTMKEGWSKFGGWSIVTRSFTKVISLFKNAVTAVKDVDSAMTELRKVTDLTTVGYERLYNSATKMATDVGSSLADTINAIADFSRVGYDIGMAQSLAEASLLYQNVADGLENVGEATDSLISTIKAFGDETYTAMNIVDMFNEVGNNFAISSAGIGEALQRSASALATAGNTLEESIGLIVAANDVVQNPEAVGTALKTLTMYIRSAKTEAEEAGLATDGMASSTAKLRKELLALTGGKIDIQIGDDQLKSTFQILQELSQVWDEIGEVSEINQARILEMLGGKRNANVLSSIIKNFKDAEEAATTAANSSGSAWEENEKYLNSIEGKTKQVQAAFETFANGVINSDLVKVWLDIQKAILDVATALNNVGMLLPTIASGLTMIKGIIDSIKAQDAASRITASLSAGNSADSYAVQNILAGLSRGQLKSLSINLDEIIQTGGATEGLKAVADQITATTGVTNTFKGAIASVGTTAKTVIAGIKASLASAGIAALISMAISGIVKLIQWISTAKERAIDAAKEINNAYSEQATSIDKNIENLEKLGKEYKDLNAKAGANGTQGNLNANEYERYKQVISEIVAISPSVIASFDKEGVALKNYSTVIEDAIAEQENLLEAQKRILVNNAETTYSGARAQISSLYNDMKKYSYQIKDAFVPDTSDWFGGHATEQMRNWLGILDTVGIKLDEIVAKSGEKNVEYHATRVSDVWLRSYDYLEQISKKSEQIREAMIASGKYSTDDITKVMNSLANLTTLLPKYESYIKSVQNTLLAFADTDEGLLQLFTNRDAMNIELLELYKDGIRDIADASKSFADQKQSVREYTEEFNRFIPEYMQVIDLEKQAQEAAKDGGQLDYSAAIASYEKLKESWADSPYILGIIEEKIKRLQTIMEGGQVDETPVDDLATSYDNLATAMQNAASASSLLEKLKKGTATLSDMIPTLEKLANAWNDAFPDDQKVWTDFASFNSDGSINIEGTISSVEQYIDAMVDFAFKDTEFAATHGEVIAKLKEDMKTFADESSSSTEKVRKLTDAISDYNTAVSLIKNVRGGNLLDSLKNIISLVDSKQFSISDFFDENGLRNDSAIIDTISTKLIDDLKRLAEVEGITWQDSWTETLKSELNAAGTEAEKTTEKVRKLTDAISNFNSAVNLIKNVRGGNLLDSFQNIISLVESGQFSISDFFDADGMKSDTEIIASISDKLIEDLKQLAQAEGITWQDDWTTTLKNELNEAGTEADKTTEKIRKLSDAISDFNSAVSLIKNIREGSLLDSFQNIISLVESGQFSMSDFFDADGLKSDTDIIGVISDNLIADLKRLAEAEGITWQDSWTTTLKDELSNAGNEAEKTTEKVRKLTDAISDFNTATSLIKNLRGGNLLDSFQNILSLVESGQFSMSDFFDADGLKNDTAIIETISDKLIADLKRLAEVEGITWQDGWTEVLKSELNEAGVEAEKTTEKVRTLTDAISDFNSAVSLVKNIRGGNLLDSFQNIISLVESEQFSMSDFFDTDGLKSDTEIIDVISTRLIDDLRKLAESEGITWQASWTDTLKEELNSAGVEAEKTEEKVRKLTDAISDFNSAVNLIKNVREGNLLDSFENIISLVESKQFSMSDFFDADGLKSDSAIIETISDKLIADLKRLAEVEGITWQDSWTETLKGELAQAGVEAEKTTEKVRKLTDAISDFNTSVNLIKNLRGGNLLDSFQNIISLVDSKQFKFTDFFDADGLKSESDIIETISDRLIADLKRLAEVEGITWQDSWTETLKGELNEAGVEAEKTTEDVRELTDAISDYNAAISLIKNIRTGDFINSLQNILSLVKNKQFRMSDFFDADGLKSEAEISATVLDNLINEIKGFVEADGITWQSEWTEQLKNGASEASGAVRTLGDDISELNDLMNFQSKIGQSVDFTSVYDDLDKIRKILGDETLNLGDIIKWQDGDFQYAFDKTDLLSNKINEFANTVVSALGLTGDEATQAAAKIKMAFGEAVTEYDALSNIVSRVKDVNSFNEMVDSFNSGDTGFLDMLTESISMAETFGLKLEDVFDFTTMQPSAQAVTLAVESAIDKMVEGKDYSAEFVQQLKDAAKYAKEVENNQKRINDAYEKSSTLSSQASSYGRDTELTYDTYKDLIAQSSKYAAAIEYVNGRLVINKQKYWEVTQEINNETKAMALLEAQQKRLEIEALEQELAGLTEAEADRAAEIQNTISRLRLEANGYELLAQELDNATDAFARFAAASDSTEGSMHSAAQEAYNIINDTLYNKDSDRYGMIGNEKYKAAIDLVIGDVDEASYDAAMAKLKRYFEDDKAGVKNFYTDLVNNGIIDATTGAFDTTISEISQKLGITEEAARSMMQQLEQYSKEGFDWEKLDPGSTLEDATTETKTLGEQLDETKQKATDATTAVNELNATKADLDDTTAQEDVKTLAEGIQNCINLISTLNAAKASIDTSPAQSALNKLIGAINNVVNKLRELDGKSVTVTVNKVEKSSGGSKSGEGGDGEASGNFVSKSWGFADARGSFRSVGGKTLVGELGRELVVDTANNRWYTVGDHGAEFVNLPKDAIVFNHLQTAQLLGNATIRRGASNASGTANDLPSKTHGPAMAMGVTGVVQLPTDLGDQVTRGAGKVSEAAEETTDALADMKDSLDEANDLMEHYIQHVEQEYYVHERASDYSSMQGDLLAEAQYYRKIYEQSMEAVRDLKAAGATENDEELREAEEAAWDAYQSMYDAIDKARDLIKDTLDDTVDEIQSAIKNMQDAISEYNESGHITIDTFQALIENGVQYLGYLRNEDGQLEINEESIQALLQARKNQLAIETAMAYIDRIREALRNNETQTLSELVDATNQLGTSTWGLVYAQLELARSEGLTDADYEQALENIKTLQQLANIAQDDINTEDDTISKIKGTYEDLNDQIDHYIKHLEQAQKVSDRFSNYQGVEDSIRAQILEYQKIIENCNKAVAEMQAEGADDTNEDLQAMEEAAWSAQQSIWSLWDALYSLRTDAITDRIDAIQASISDFSTAMDEVAESGSLSLDTFQAILENGLQYLQFLNVENGQLSLNTEAVEQMIRAKKEQLAVETAMSYLNQIEEALLAGEATKVQELVWLNEQLSESTWAAVYAKLALLKTEGLSDEDALQVESYIEKLQNLSSMVETDIAAPVVQTMEDILGDILDKFNEIKEDLEHYIAHQEQKFTLDERAMDFGGMSAALQNEIDYYSHIYAEAQKTIGELLANGADDTTSELQEVEEAAWSAYNSMNDAFDKMNALRIDELNEELDRLTGTYSNLQKAIEEFEEDGKISLDSFEELLNGGIQYLTFLEKEDGQYKLNEQSIQDYLSARKEQLAIETALSYLENIKQALQNGEVQRVHSLIDATNELSTGTWDLVFAQAAELKMLGLSDGEYNTLIDNLNKLRDLSKVVETNLVTGDDADPVKDVSDAFDTLNKELEHYIAHQEQAFKERERAWDFTGMENALKNEVQYYKRIVEEGRKAINEMKLMGADDTNEAFQNVEETVWSASNSMYEALDKIRTMRIDALTDEIDNLSKSFNNFKGAADEYNQTGGITLDTFNSIVEGGMQYLSLLDEENGKYVIANDRLQDYLQMRKEQLAIETAMSYVSEIREALENDEEERVRKLIDATNGLSASTWDLVYAQAAALKAEGLSNEQYETIVGNIDRLRALATAVNTDLTDAGENLESQYKAQQDALDRILKFTEDLIRAEAKDRIQAIKDEIEAYKEIIELKKESLQQTKQETEYQDEVADKIKEIAQLQAKADLLSLDTSRTASAERQRLLQDIQSKQDELSKYQADHAYDAQVEALDKEAEAYEKSRQDEIAAIEASVSSEEKVYQLAIARIRDQWDTLYEDLINWNTEQGSVINQEITDAWEDAFAAVQKYGDYLSALAGVKNDIAGLNANGNLVVADIPKYHGGGVAGDKGKLNDEEVLAVLQKGELVVDKEQKKGLYAVVDFVKSLGERLGTKIGSLANLGMAGQMMPAFAGMAEPSSAGFVENNNITFNPSFNVNINGEVGDQASAREYGRTLAQTAADSLFDAFNRRGINIVQTLRQ